MAVGYLPAVKYEIKFIRVLAVIINRTIVARFERASRVAGLNNSDGLNGK